MINTWTFVTLSVLLHALSRSPLGQRTLSVRGGDLVLGGERVYLSGVNQAWVNYGRDFGNGNYNASRPAFIRTLDMIHDSGGNSVRIWLHIGGSTTPNFNSSGYVTGLDPYILHDLTDLLNEAEKRNIVINIVLWNCAVKPGGRLNGLLYDDSKLQSYIDNALRPMVRALRNSSSLGIWEIINEPEGCVAVGRSTTEICYSTTTLNIFDFADWTNAEVPLQRLLIFIGRQTAAIHEENSKALVTVGSWTFKSVTGEFGRRNFYSDHCLHVASGKNASGLDLYQIHTYSTLGVYLPRSPFKVSAKAYNLNKPLIIGEFSQKKGGGRTSVRQYSWGYYHGFCGTWGWSIRGGDSAADSPAVLMKGMRALEDKNNQSAGGRVNFVIPSETQTHSENGFYFYVYQVLQYMYWIFVDITGK